MNLKRFKNGHIVRPLENREVTNLKSISGFYAYVARTNKGKCSTDTYTESVDTGTTYTPLRGTYMERSRTNLLWRIRLAISNMGKI